MRFSIKMILPELTEIERIRKKMGITQTELSKKAGVSQSLIARIEAKTVDPRYSKVKKIFRALHEIKKEDVTAKDLMTRGVVGVRADDTIEDAVAIMSRFKVSQMPIFSRRRIIGSISEKVVIDNISKGVNMKEFSTKKVSELMDGPFPTVNPNTPITTLSKLLEHDKAVIVVEKGEVKGIITNADLLKVVSK